VPDLVAQLPPGSSYILFADLAALRASPLLEHLAALLAPSSQDADYAAFVSQTGFDYTRDLDRVAVAVFPALRKGSLYVIADGRFDRGKITGYALRAGRREQQDGREVYIVSGATPGQFVAFSFLAPHRIALAGASRLSPAPSGSPDTTLLERVTRVAGSPVFLVGRMDSPPKGFSIAGWRSDQLDNLMRSLRWFSVVILPLDDRLKIVLDAECDSPENARQLAGTLDGVRLLAKAALADPETRRKMDPVALPLIDSLLRSAATSQNDRIARLVLELSREEIAGSLAPASRDTPPPRK